MITAPMSDYMARMLACRAYREQAERQAVDFYYPDDQLPDDVAILLLTDADVSA